MSKIAELTLNQHLANPWWYPTLWGLYAQAQANQVGVAGRVFLSPIWVPRRVWWEIMAMRVGVAGGAGTTLRLGLYRDYLGSPEGQALIFDSGPIAADSIGVKDAGPIPTGQLLDKGIVWFALHTQDAVVQYVRHSILQFFNEQASERFEGCSFDQAYGPLPAVCPAVVLNRNARVNGFIHFMSMG